MLPPTPVPAPTPAAVQEFVLTTPWRLQEAGEIQATLSADRARADRAWAGGVAAEYGVTSRLQLAAERDFAVVGEPASWGAELLVDPRLLRAGGAGRLVLGAARQWPAGGARASNDVFLLGGLAHPRFELHLEARLRDVSGDARGAVSAAGTWGRGCWAAILEGAHTAGDAGTLRVSPGFAWHPGGGLEITAGVPLRLGPGGLDPGFALRLSGETEVIR